MSYTNSLKKLFFLTNLNNNNMPIELSKKNISLSKNNYKKINNSYNKDNKLFNIYDKRYYKLNNDLNIYPSPEAIQNNKLKPIIFKTGLINSNSKNIKKNSQFYFPIMKKTENIDEQFQSFPFDDFSGVSKTKNLNLSYKIKKIKTEGNLNKSEIDNNKDNNKDNNNKDLKDNKHKNNNNKNKKESEISPFISYSLDKFGKIKLKRSGFNLDIYKKNVEQKNGRRIQHKEQILMRNKYQHINNYNKKNFVLLDNDDTIQNETNRLVDFQPEISRLNTENNEINNYDKKKIFARDIIKEKLPSIKVTGYDQLYMNLMTHIRPKEYKKELNDIK